MTIRGAIAGAGLKAIDHFGERMPTRANIDTLQQEALRLLRQQIGLIKEMTTVENLVVSEKDIVSGAGQPEKQSFTSESALEDMEVLGEEIEKLERLVLVVAVVGTMKAGKSTAINAIVGTEVLPSRNRPMTAVPTLIRHKPNVVDPVLRFENHGPVDDLVRRLGAALKRNPEGALESEMNSDPHFKELVNSVKRGGPFRTQYEGADEIAEFLKDLNDLARLSKALNVAFPFDQYDSVEDMPVVEVEFAHIKAAQSAGELCLLDTPGPNESDQPHLHKILREQLAKASAVVVVLDYTQIGSDADAQVRSEIEKIADTMGDRAYALVNKFDERDRHGDDEAQLRFRVSEGLLKDSVSADRVFPVSAKWAYLANRARNELHKRGGLPENSATGARWVEDFAREALGRRWEEEIGDVEKVSRNVHKLWEDSLFGKFLEDVIRTAHDDAAMLAIDSASAKLGVYGERISNCLAIRENSLRRSADGAIMELKAQIEALEADSKSVNDSKKRALKLAEDLLDAIQKDLNKVCMETGNRLRDVAVEFFKQGRAIERGEHERKKKAGAKGSRLRQIIRKLRDSTQSESSRLFNPSESKIEIEKKEEAHRLMKSVSDGIEQIKDSAERDLKEEIATALSDHIPRVYGTLKDATRNVATAVNERLGEDFDVHIEPPRTESLEIERLTQESLNNTIAEEAYLATQRRRQSGVWGTFCEWLGTEDWGWEEYLVEKTKYVIEIPKIRDTVERSAKDFIGAAEKGVIRDIERPLRDAVERSCDDLKDKIRRLHGDFKQSIRDQNMAKETQQALIKEIDRVVLKAKKVKVDLDGLGEDVKNFGAIG